MLENIITWCQFPNNLWYFTVLNWMETRVKLLKRALNDHLLCSVFLHSIIHLYFTYYIFFYILHKNCLISICLYYFLFRVQIKIHYFCRKDVNAHNLRSNFWWIYRHALQAGEYTFFHKKIIMNISIARMPECDLLCKIDGSETIETIIKVLNLASQTPSYYSLIVQHCLYILITGFKEDCTERYFLWGKSFCDIRSINLMRHNQHEPRPKVDHVCKFMTQ